METLGHPIDRSALVRIEKGNRRVTVSEFLVIAAALDVSPLALLDSGEDVLDIGEVSLAPDQAQRWLAGEDPGEAVTRALIESGAERFAREARVDDLGLAQQLARKVLGDDALMDTFREATLEAPKRRSLLMHLVMSTAAYSEDFQRNGWTDEGETE